MRTSISGITLVETLAVTMLIALVTVAAAGAFRRPGTDAPSVSKMWVSFDAEIRRIARQTGGARLTDAAGRITAIPLSGDPIPSPAALANVHLVGAGSGTRWEVAFDADGFGPCYQVAPGPGLPTLSIDHFGRIIPVESPP